MDNIVEGLQIAFDKLKAGIDAFGDDLQNVRSRTFVNQGAIWCLVMKPVHLPVFSITTLLIGIQCEHREEESSAEFSVADYNSSEFFNIHLTNEKR